MERRILSLGCLLLGVVLLNGRLAKAQESAATTPLPGAAPAEDLASKRAKVAERIAKLTAEIGAAAAKSGQSPPALNLEEELDLVESLDLVYLEQQSAAEQRATFEQHKNKWTQEAALLKSHGLAEPKPYSFLLLEDIRDQLAAEDDRTDATEADLAAAEELLQAAREDFEEHERDRRAARETLQENGDAGRQAELAAELRLAELKSNVAQETVNLRRAEVEAKTVRQEANEIRRDLLEEKVDLIAEDARFTKQDYESRLHLLSKARDEFRRRLKDVERGLHQLDADQPKILAQLRQQGAEAAMLELATEAFQLIRSVSCEEITLINQRLAEVDHDRRFLNCRSELAGGKLTPDELSEWYDELSDSLDQCESMQRLRTLRLQELHVDQATLYRRAQFDAAENERLRPWIDSQTAQLQRLVELYETSLSQLQTEEHCLQRLLDDLEEGSEKQSLAERFAEAWDFVVAFWNFELEKVDDHPITVGKIVSGILYLVLGTMLARLVSGLVGRRLLRRVGLDEGASHAVQAILFYSLCIVFCLLALDLVNLPFAAFTFLGGAAAIGIGFGSQNILNNFISGLILLAEQPLRVGDLVDIDGKTGTVEKIGARSTRIRTMANHEIVVPNSKLLEDKVTNLTLSDNLVRAAMSVTLSPTLSVEEVRRRLLVAARHPKVLTSPAPVVLFLGFSNSELSFELHFWIKLDNLMECRIVESEVREAINTLLANTDAATSAAGNGPPIVAPPTDLAVPRRVTGEPAAAARRRAA